MFCLVEDSGVDAIRTWLVGRTFWMEGTHGRVGRFSGNILWISKLAAQHHIIM
jgi:hypothetical protein